MDITLEIPERNLNYFIRMANLVGASNIRKLQKTEKPSQLPPDTRTDSKAGVCPLSSLLQRRLFEVGISCYARNRLAMAGVLSVADLVSRNREELAAMGYIGSKTMSEIDMFMSNNSLQFGTDISMYGF